MARVFYEGDGRWYDSVTEKKYAAGFNEVLGIEYVNQEPTFYLRRRVKYPCDFTLPELGDGNTVLEVKGMKFAGLEKKKLHCAAAAGHAFMGDGNGFLYYADDWNLVEARLVRCLSCGTWHLSVAGKENKVASFFCKNHCSNPRIDVWANFFEATQEHVYGKRQWPLGDMRYTDDIAFDENGIKYVNGIAVNDDKEAW